MVARSAVDDAAMRPWTPRSTEPVIGVDAFEPDGWGLRRVTYEVREIVTRLPAGTPGGYHHNGYTWAINRIVYAPGLRPDRPKELCLYIINASAALSWLASNHKDLDDRDFV